MNTESLIKLIETYAVARGLTVSTVSSYAAASGDMHARLVRGHDITTRRAAQITQWFSDHWPVDLPWPVDTGAGALGASLAKLLDATGSGIVHLDGRGRIVAANDRAQGLLRTGNGLFDEGGFLYARRREDDAKLQGLLTRVLPPFGAQGAGGSTMVRRSSALPPLVLHVNPVGRQEANFHLWPVAALVLVVDPASHARIDPAVAAATLGLTGMESRVAVLLAEGMSVSEIAAATGRGESTIRSHVKHMFARHGLSRQADLVRLVLSLAGAPESRL